MELGEKIRQARLETGMSQRELCAGEITRNMLSLIENGAARPSMKTLSLLAQRLGKPVSWFLEEEAAVSPNARAMDRAREAFDAGRWEEAVEALRDFSQPDAVYGRERDLLWDLSHLALAEAALNRGQAPYAARLLEPVGRSRYCGTEISRRRLLMMGRLGQKVSEELPSLDEELLLRGREALEAGDPGRAGVLLDAAQDQGNLHWQMLRGEVLLKERRFREAASCFHRAETEYPRETAPGLEACYRELGDFRRAYEYACKGR